MRTDDRCARCSRRVAFTELPRVQRLAMYATLVAGLFAVMFGALLVWIAATTGEAIVLNPHRYGEAWLEAALLWGLLGVMCYGTALFDWWMREPRWYARTDGRQEVPHDD